MSDTQDGFRDIPWNRVFTGGGTAAFYASLVVFIALCVFVTNRDLAFDASRPFPWWQEKSEATTSGGEPDRPVIPGKDIAALEKKVAEAGHKQFTVWSALVQFADVVSLQLLCYFGSRRYHFLKRELADEAKRTRALSGSDFNGQSPLRRITQNAGPRWVSVVNMLPAHHRNSLRRDFDKSGRAHAYVASLLREYGMTYGSIQPSATDRRRWDRSRAVLSGDQRQGAHLHRPDQVVCSKKRRPARFR